MPAQAPQATETAHTRHWRVRVLPDSARQLSDATLRQVASRLERRLKSASDEELLAAARDIQKAHLLDRVHLVRDGGEDIVVSLLPRRPVLRIEADITRWLTATGKIYGEVSTDSPKSRAPLLRGVFERTPRNFHLSDDQVVILSEEETRIVSEAVELLQQATRSGFALREIEFVKYRGFVLALANDGPLVSVGRAPFDASLKHLGTVLATLQKKGSQALRIELDYSGKAFVKERKL
jgi:hypothetical protein